MQKEQSLFISEIKEAYQAHAVSKIMTPDFGVKKDNFIDFMDQRIYDN